jgi:hypothetical protein
VNILDFDEEEDKSEKKIVRGAQHVQHGSQMPFEPRRTPRSRPGFGSTILPPPVVAPFSC